MTFSQIQVANDGIAIVSNTDLKIGCMSTDNLKALWEPDSKISNYSQLGDQPDGTPFPDAEVSLFGPGTDSGTFDFFTEEINGEKGDTRKDYQPSEDDNVLVQGVEGDKNGLGYFGFSYYEDNADKLNLIAVDSGDGCVKPDKTTIQGKHLQAAVAAAVHVPQPGIPHGQAAGEGLHGLHHRERRGARDDREDHPAHGRAADRGPG